MKLQVRSLIVVMSLVSSLMTATVQAQDATPESKSAAPNLVSGAEEILKGAAAAKLSDVEAVATKEPMTVTVRQCIDLALANNAKALMADDSIAVAKAQKGVAVSRLMPEAKIGSAYVYVDGLEAPGGILGGVTGGLMGEKKSRTDTFTVKQVLFAGGQIVAGVKASKFLAESKEWQKQAALKELEFETSKAYYDCLLARNLVKVAEDSVTTFNRHLQDAQKMFDVGVISNFEVLRAKTEVGTREADMATAKNMQRLATVNLCRIIVVPQDTPLVLDENLTWTPVEATAEDLVKQASEKRPELLALRKGIDAADQNIKRTKGQFLPSAAAQAQWSNTDGGGSTRPDGWTLSVGAEWDIFTGGRRIHEVAEAKAGARELQHQLEDVQRLVETDVRQAYIQVQDAISKIQRENGNVELATEGRRLAQVRFQEGVGTQSEVLDAELALSGAETSLAQALRDYAVAQAALDKATAKGVPESGCAASSTCKTEKK
jgi:outer membrane protein TolC